MVRHHAAKKSAEVRLEVYIMSKKSRPIFKITVVKYFKDYTYRTVTLSTLLFQTEELQHHGAMKRQEVYSMSKKSCLIFNKYNL